MKRFDIFQLMVLSAILIPFHSICQLNAPVSVSWSQCYGGYDDDDIFTAKATPDSGVIMGGMSMSSDGDLYKNNGDYDWWVLKIDKNRDTVFSRSYGGSKYDKCRYAIGNNGDGTSLAFGSLHSLDDGDVDTSQIVGQAESAWWLLKLDVHGNMIYQKLYNGNGLHGGRSMLQTDDGYLLCGWSTSTNNVFSGNYGSYDTYLMKIDGNGNTQWIKNYGGSESDRCRAVVQTLDGGYAFNGGSFSNDNDFSAQNHGSRDIMVVKVDSLGNTLWSRLYGGSGIEHAFGISLDWDGNLLVCGEDSANSGDCNGVNGAYDGWILKLDQATGDTIWTMNLGGSEYDVAMRFLSLPDKGYIALLSTNSTDGLLSGQALGHGDIWLVRLDSLRNVVWSKTFGGYWGETANDIQVFDNGYMVWGLTASSDGDVIGHHISGNNDTNKDVWAFFVVDSTLNSSVVTGISNNLTLSNNLDFTISPSPSNGSFYLEVLSNEIQEYEIEISNSIGEIVKREVFSSQNGKQKKEIHLTENGIYNVTVRNASQQQTRRMIVYK